MTTRPPDPLEQHAAHFIARKNEEVASLCGGVHGAESVSRQMCKIFYQKINKKCCNCFN